MCACVPVSNVLFSFHMFCVLMSRVYWAEALHMNLHKRQSHWTRKITAGLLFCLTSMSSDVWQTIDMGCNLAIMIILMIQYCTVQYSHCNACSSLDQMLRRELTQFNLQTFWIFEHIQMCWKLNAVYIVNRNEKMAAIQFALCLNVFMLESNIVLKPLSECP